jgi:hypothetical protein
MTRIEEVLCADEKTIVSRAVIHALPKWFSPPEDIERKAIAHRDMPFMVAYDGTKSIGFAALKVHNSYTAEVYALGVKQVSLL